MLGKSAKICLIPLSETESCVLVVYEDQGLLFQKSYLLNRCWHFLVFRDGNIDSVLMSDYLCPSFFQGMRLYYIHHDLKYTLHTV